MDIEYKSGKLRKVCENPQNAQKEHGKQIGIKLTLRVGQLKAANNLNDMTLIPAAEFHQLEGGRKDQFAVTLVHPFRLVFSAVCDENTEITNLKEIEIIRIEEVVDYHGKKKK